MDELIRLNHPRGPHSSGRRKQHIPIQWTSANGGIRLALLLSCSRSTAAGTTLSFGADVHVQCKTFRNSKLQKTTPEVGR